MTIVFAFNTTQHPVFKSNVDPDQLATTDMNTLFFKEGMDGFLYSCVQCALIRLIRVDLLEIKLVNSGCFTR